MIYVPQYKKSYVTLGTTNAIVFSANSGGAVPLDNKIRKSEDDVFKVNGSEIECDFDGIITVNASINFTYKGRK